MLQALSRQVTDLSAAGANLFHAVIELQRLRASSERKFQRWFNETRKEHERQQEISAQLEHSLIQERDARRRDNQKLRAEYEDAFASRERADKMVNEIKRELQISKDESRRAWEELGRREQAERDRMTALKEGRAIDIGGIQVLPTMRQDGGGAQYGAMSEDEGTIGGDDGQVTGQRGGVMHPGHEYHLNPSPTTTDPFTETAPYAQPQPATTNGVTVHTSVGRTSDPTASEPFYRLPTTYLHSTGASAATIPASAASAGAEASQSTVLSEEGQYSTDHDEEEYVDEHGRPVVGHRLPHSNSEEDEDDDDFDVSEQVEHERKLAEKYGRSTTAVEYPHVPAPSSSRIAPVSAPHVPRLATTSAQNSPAAYSGAVAPSSSSAAGAAGTAAAGRSQPQAPLPPLSHAPPHAGGSAGALSPADYSGSGWENWEHRQGDYRPTRLSDVMEMDEEERSRISEVSHPGHGGGGIGPF